ncbi:hypothetical protein EBT25_18755, partial [bacterium]|nr:hypothetical protein [bacterium]
MSLDAMKLALYALERGETKLRYEAITALRAAIEKTERPWQGLTDEDVDEIERWIEFKEDGSGRI